MCLNEGILIMDTQEMRLSFDDLTSSFFADTTTLQYRVSPGKNTVDDRDASTTTIKPLHTSINTVTYTPLTYLSYWIEPVTTTLQTSKS